MPFPASCQRLIFRGFDAFFTDRFDWLSGALTGDLTFTTIYTVGRRD